MDNVELVIKIYKNTYDRITSRFADEDDIVLFENLLKNGTLLPEGHGRLIDEDALEIRNITVLYGYDWECGENTYADMEVVRADDIWNAPTIIEADKGEEE